MFVGEMATSGEVWAATKEGLQAARSVRKIRVGERWNVLNHVRRWHQAGAHYTEREVPRIDEG